MITTILTLHVIIVITYNVTCSMSPNTLPLTLNYLEYIILTLKLLYKKLIKFIVIGNGMALVSSINVPWYKAITIIDSSMITIRNFALLIYFSYMLDIAFLYYKNSFYISLHNMIINTTWENQHYLISLAMG